MWILKLYPFDADASENHRWFFKDTPNESRINAYAKLLHTYNETYNKYGGLLNSLSVSTTRGDVNALICKKTESSEMLAAEPISGVWHHWFSKHYATYCQTNTLNSSLTGTFQAADVDITEWPYALDHDLYYATGLNELRSDSILLRAIIEDLF
jgi:hypothetical protein